jgi:hypothetical protein
MTQYVTFDGACLSSYVSMMEKLVLVGSEPLRLALPTPHEIEVVEQFTRQSEALEALQRLVAKWSARAVNDLKVIDAAATDIFETLNVKIENELSEKIPEFERWSLFSSQPRFLARAFGSIVSLDRFIECGFGAPNFIASYNDSCSLKEVSAFQDFFLLSFLDEIRLIQEIEIAPNTTKIVEQTPSNGFGLDSRYGAYKEWTHTFIIRIDNDKSLQCAVKIHDGKLFQFIDDIHNIPNNISITVLEDRLRNKVHRFDRTYRDRYLQKVRQIQTSTLKISNIENFSKKWDRQSYCKKLEMDLANHANLNYIEEKIYYGIIKTNLDNAPTDSHSIALADGETGNVGVSTTYSESLAEKLASIDAFAAQNPGAPVSGQILETFPELLKIQAPERVTLPSEPPAHWPEDRIAVKGVLETPPDFMRRNYAQWLGKGLTRADIRRLDKPLSTALDNWLRRNPMPDDLDLPTLKEQNSRWIDRIEREGIGAVSAEGDVEAILKHGQRLLSAKRRRERD